VPDIVPPTALVETMNVALVDPAGTVTVEGTLTGSVPDNDTTTPPPGAAPLRIAVPVTEFPPTTLDALSEIEASATDAVTVNIADCLLLPLNDAVIVAVPAAIAETMNVALDAPAGTMTDDCTPATAGLLLDNETLAPPPDAAPVRLTVPGPLLPTAMLVAFNVTFDTAIVFVGPVGDAEPPH
jgi:hypothetical protein